MSDAPCEIAAWDTAHFGFTIARTSVASPTAEEVERILAWCEENGVRCLYHLADPADVASLAAVSARGFELMDIRGEFDAPTETRVGPEMPAGHLVRSAVSGDLPSLSAIAAEAFVESRFVRDPRFPIDRLGAMYVAWVERSLERGAVLVVERDGVAGGFVALERDGEAVRAQLLGLAPGFRGMGVGPALFTEVLRWGRENGLAKMLSAASMLNVPSVRMHEVDGLKLRAVSLWYHRWFPETR